MGECLLRIGEALGSAPNAIHWTWWYRPVILALREVETTRAEVPFRVISGLRGQRGLCETVSNQQKQNPSTSGWRTIKPHSILIFAGWLMKLAFLSSLWTRKDYQSTHQVQTRQKFQPGQGEVGTVTYPLTERLFAIAERGEDSFLQWNDTWHINHIPGQADNKNKLTPCFVFGFVLIFNKREKEYEV